MNTDSDLLNYITKKYEIYKNAKITMEILEDISKNENIEMKDLLCLLEINTNTIYKLKKKQQRYTILKFNKYIGINCDKIILNGVIDKKEFIKLREELNMKNYTLVRLLGISRYKYNKLKNNQINKIRVIDVKIKHTVDLMKLDLKYIKSYKKNEYYSKEELENICQKRRITLEQFIKYYNINPKHYKLNKIVIEKSEKGLWIGENIKIPNDFVNQNFYEIQRKLYGVINKYNNIIKWYKYKEELVQDAIGDIFTKCGEIVKKFYFDINLTINILVAKCKYIMFNNYKKMHMSANIYYEDYAISIDHLNLLKDNRYNPQNISI